MFEYAEDDLRADLWTVYLMLLENDGRNLHVLKTWGRLVAFVELLWGYWLGEELKTKRVRPGWPIHYLEEKSLLLAIMKMADIRSESVTTSAFRFS